MPSTHAGSRKLVAGLRRAGQGVALCALAWLAWWGLQRPPSPADWLQVAAPCHGSLGESYRVRVTLRAAAFLTATPGLRLGVDLHGSDAWHGPRGWIASAPARPIASPTATMTFDVPIPVDHALGFVHAVLFVSPTGEWRQRVADARSVDVPIRAPMDATADTLQPLLVYDPAPRADRAPGDRLAIRVVLAVGWFAFAASWWRRRPHGAPRPRLARPWCVVAAAAAGWELLPAERQLGQLAREFAIDRHWYALRADYQHVLTVTIVVAAAALLMRTWHRRDSLGTWLASSGLTLHLLATAAGFLSLHAVDAVLATAVAGAPLLQVVQLTALSIASLGTLLQWTRPGVAGAAAIGGG